MNEFLVSVIVPVYNAEKWLKKCISSIMKQSYKNIEIILIDDGSKDRSLKICQQYEKIDSRITVMSKDNGGVSSARNIGLDYANGSFVTFVDSDDFLPLNSLQKMYSKMVESNADFCMGRIMYISALKNCPNNLVRDRQCRRKDTVLFSDFINGMDTGPCGKMYKLSTIKQNKISFDETVQQGEDTLFLYEYLRNCDIVSSVEDTVYYINGLMEVSLSRTSYHENLANNLLRCMDEFCAIFEDIHDIYTKKSIDYSIIRFFKISCGHYISCLSNQPDLCLSKLQETRNLFSVYLDSILIQNVDDSDKLWIDRICSINHAEELNEFVDEKKFRTIKKIVIKSLSNIKLIMLFGLNAVC